MRILVTGGLGTVGRPLVHELRARGNEVVVCDLLHSHDPDYIRCDIGNFRQIERIIIDHGKIDLIYHLAAEFGRWNGEDYYEQLWSTNVIGTKHLIRLQEREGFRMVFFSSSEVYGDWEGIMAETVMDENEVRQLNDYAMTKWVGEQQILNSAQQKGTETVRVRLFNTYGPGEHYTPYRSAICKFIYHAMTDRPYTVFLGHTRTSTYITDTVRTLANISGSFKSGKVYNVAGTELHDMKQVSDLILETLGKQDDRVEYVEGEPFTTMHKKVDVTPAVEDLDHTCSVPLETGIPKTIDWMVAEYRQIESLRWD